MSLKHVSTRVALMFAVLVVIGVVARIIGPLLGSDSYIGRDLVIFGPALAALGAVGAVISLIVGAVRSSSAQPAPGTPGWYADPHNPDLLRYFDGGTWTRHTTPRQPGG